MPNIFISYRREDTRGYAGRLYDQLSAQLGDDHVFMDVADIEPGSDFVDTIDKKVGECDVLIALIGKDWLTIKDDQNRPRLGSQGDFVSVEIAAALKRNVDVVPVLVGGAQMPAQRDLPESLQPLARRQAVEISDAHFIRDVSDLIEVLKKPAGTRTSPTNWIKPPLAAALVVAIGGGGIAFWMYREKPHARRPLQRLVIVQQPNSTPTGDKNPSARVVSQADITGNWKAIVEKDKVRYEVYFTFEKMGNKLLGKAIYPTGEAGILNGSVREGFISFTTKHVPNFADEPATIEVQGRVFERGIEVMLQDKDGLAKGFAHRVAETGQPKVLSQR